jgi:hypothetical protein
MGNNFENGQVADVHNEGEAVTGAGRARTAWRRRMVFSG